jgi:hypothetical protein
LSGGRWLWSKVEDDDAVTSRVGRHTITSTVKLDALLLRMVGHKRGLPEKLRFVTMAHITL